MEGKGTDGLLSDVGSRGTGGRSDGDGHDGNAEDSTASEPDNAEGAMDETETETAPGARMKSTKRGGSRNE